MDTMTLLYGAGLLILGVVLGGALHASWVERHERREYRRHRSQYLRAKAERLEIQNQKLLNDYWAEAEGRLSDVAPGTVPEPAPIPLHVSEEAKRALRGVNETERFVATAPPATVVAFDTQNDATFDPEGWPDLTEDDGDAKSGGDGSPAGAGEHEGAADRGADDDGDGGVGEPPDEEAEDPFYVDHRVHPLDSKLQSANLRLTRSFNPPD